MACLFPRSNVPLVGNRSINQLAAYIAETMPEDDPEQVSGDAARQVADYIHGAIRAESVCHPVDGIDRASRNGCL